MYFGYTVKSSRCQWWQLKPIVENDKLARCVCFSCGRLVPRLQWLVCVAGVSGSHPRLKARLLRDVVSIRRVQFRTSTTTVNDVSASHTSPGRADHQVVSHVNVARHSGHYAASDRRGHHSSDVVTTIMTDLSRQHAPLLFCPLLHCWALETYIITVTVTVRHIHVFIWRIFALHLQARSQGRVGNGSRGVTHDPLTHQNRDPWPTTSDPWPITVINVHKYSNNKI